MRKPIEYVLHDITTLARTPSSRYGSHDVITTKGIREAYVLRSGTRMQWQLALREVYMPSARETIMVINNS